MKILIVDELHPSILPLLEAIGAKVDNYGHLNRKETEARIGQYDGLIIRSKFFIDEAFLKQAPKLQFIGRAGAGLDLIDLEACARRNVKVFAANEANRVAVAEHLLGMILSLFNHLNTACEEISAGKWLREKNRGEELQGKTVGIIGYGHNGSETAARFAAFGCRVLVYDKYKSGFGSGGIEEVELDKIYAEAEIVSLHIPLSTETRNWVDATFFSRFHRPVYFCNVARGEIMRQRDLVEAIRSGQVSGACLDVLENEKLDALTPDQQQDFDFLKSHRRVILTPHVAGWSRQSYEKINAVLCRQIAELVQDRL